MFSYRNEEQSSFKGVALAAMPVVAVLGASMPAPPAHAAAQDLLSGKPKIGTVRAMVPKGGRYAGRLVVWVRVDQAPGTPRGVRRERPETVHTGRVVARVAGRSRVATAQLDLDRRSIPRGYFLRFPKSTAKAVSAGIARRVPVSLRVAQTVDLDSDGHAEERAAIAATRRVPLATPPTTIEPKDGEYDSAASDALFVAAGHVTGFRFISAASGPCGFGIGGSNEVEAPIDPQTGLFGFAKENEGFGSIPTTETSVNGEFNDDQSAMVFATVAVPSTTCSYSITNHDFGLLK